VSAVITSRPDRRTPLLCGLLLLIGLGVLIGLTTPWHPLPGPVPGGRVHPDAALDFTAQQIARETSYHDQIRPWGLFALSLSIVVPAIVGLSPIGGRLVGRVRTRWWWLQAFAGAVGVTVLTLLVLLPIAAHEHTIERHFGLTSEGWSGWFTDVARGYLVTIVSTTGVVLILVGLARRAPRRWWIWAACAGAALVIIGSFVYPFTVEPLFTSTTSLPAGPLRTSLLALARQDGQPLKNILVAHEGGRTNAENAYVSGFGSSRRLVLYDTLLADDTPREIRALTAHELGHSKYHDVLRGTLEGAIGVAAAMCVAGAVLGEGRRLPRLGGASGLGDPRIVPLLLASYTVISFAISPLYNLVSRHVEARADAHSLALDRDPEAFVTAQRKLAISGLDDLSPSPVLFALFFDHPTTPARIAMARDWALQHHVAVPPGVG
jgi:STE24 endopeptidase